MKQWQLQIAKARFSEVVKEAVNKGPQEITVHGESVVVILSKEKYTELTASKLNFVDLIRQSPLVHTGIKFKRDTSLTREIDL